MLPEKQVSDIRAELESAKRPIFFFHDDADGLCSFLLLYRFIREGRGVVVKSTPCLTKKIYAKKVQEYGADKVFVLDLAIIEQDFIDEVKIPVIWIDHHDLLERSGVRYFNTRTFGSPEPPSLVCYEVVKQDSWIAACGCISDWFLPLFLDDFRRDYPDLIGSNLAKPEDILFKSALGKLIRILSFNLKGSTKEAIDSIKVLTRISSPYEVLGQTTPQGRYLYKKFAKVNEHYEKLLEKALRHVNTKLVIFTYPAGKYSFTSDLSNEISYLYPEKVLVFGRLHNDDYKLSLRRGTNQDIDLRKILERALTGIEGFGGGHESACGASVKKKDFERFVENIKSELKPLL